MEQKSKKSIHQYMRGLHRDIGFLILGMVLIYCLSGVTMILRDKGFLKQTKQIEKIISPNMEVAALADMLHIKDFKVLKTEKDMVYFKEGTYNKATGAVKYSETEYPAFLKKITNWHKAPSKTITSIFSIIFGCLLAFMAISSFWMFKPGTRLFRRGILFVGIGIVVVIALLLL